MELAEKLQQMEKLDIPLFKNEPSRHVLLYFNKKEGEISKNASVGNFVRGLVEANVVGLALKKRMYKEVEGKHLCVILNKLNEAQPKSVV